MSDNECFFFVQDPAGTGKTFLYDTLHCYVRSKTKTATCVASSGITSLLLPNGMTSHDLVDIISRMYPPQLLSCTFQDFTVFAKVAILTTYNSTVDQINQIVLDKLPGASHVFDSADTADVSNSDDCGEVFQVSPEYMITLNPRSFPPSKLTLKVGALVVLL